ncbi:hypothetical protein BZF66_06915 [Salmonella enterica]|uniref:hypothetical protein n=1 Tax=Salmonella enterica TaxID=28901 RepID=UPI000FDF8F26|nr:hypothetical protein CPT_Munch_244 [Salmonella phage Munch]EAZ2023028.1 hypothetical protein [Salmonella enterica]ECV9084164.1 hypothetical protein [Salmonella enterica subsp. enterica serovar Infantis]MCP0435735.1 hypothetical protein [Salmonella enterica subsp. enterica serovar Mbandaka]EHX8550480.1 hypothetical protein [Salmonella enterica]
MSTENQNAISIDIVDIINAAKIMEQAVKNNAFSVEELVEVSPVVARFITVANQLIEQHNAAVEAAEAAEAGDTEGEVQSESKGE